MQTEHVQIHRRATTALDALAPLEQESVYARLEALRHLPARQWPKQGARRLTSGDKTYLLQVTPNLLVFFSKLPGRNFLIEDFIRPATMERIANGRAQPANQR